MNGYRDRSISATFALLYGRPCPDFPGGSKRFSKLVKAWTRDMYDPGGVRKNPSQQRKAVREVVKKIGSCGSVVVRNIMEC
jgi:hypothetical protein